MPGATRPIATARLVDLVEPDLSAEAARLVALHVRGKLHADARLLAGRPPAALVTLFEHLERAPIPTRRRGQR
jgi:hypothetical protein